MRENRGTGRDVVEREAVRGRESVKVVALRMLMRVAGELPFEKPQRTKRDRLVRRLLVAGASERDIRNAIGCSRDELLATLWRIAN